SPAQREQGRRRMRELRREPALRLRAGVDSWQVHDLWAGEVTGAVDDLVLRRGDGVVAYNLAVVVDDAAAGIDQVVRADDLLSSAPRQAYLAHLLELPEPGYAHVPLAVGASGARLAKRDGAVTLRDRLALGESPAQVMERIGDSLGLPGCRTAADVLERWDPASLPRHPWVAALPGRSARHGRGILPESSPPHTCYQPVTKLDTPVYRRRRDATPLLTPPAYDDPPANGALGMPCRGRPRLGR